jgi:hypothetical protein
MTAGWRHHGSRRSVFSAICALVLAGACVTCVIDASALMLKLMSSVTALGHRSGALHAVPAQTGGAALPALPTEPYSNGNGHTDPGVTSGGVRLATPAH